MTQSLPPVSSPSSGGNGQKKGDRSDTREERSALPVIMKEFMKIQET